MLLLSCNPYKKNQDLISIDKNWEIEGLKLNQSSINDFEKFSQIHDLTFVKDSIQNDYPINDTLEYCGNDYNLYNITYKFSNKELGLNLYIEKNTYFDSSSFIKYEISKLNKVNFKNNFSPIISKSQLNKIFKYNADSSYYYTELNQKNVSLKVSTLDKDTYEIKSLRVYHK